MRRLPSLLAAVAAVALCAGPADAARRPAKPAGLLWATVNICDTAGHPDGIGIRGSMPGTGVAAQQMFMRFQLQYLPTGGKWTDLGAAGDSGFLAVGSAKYRARQSGRTFTVRPPDGGTSMLRGAVTFEWRQDGEVVKRQRLATTAGHGRTQGADPSSFSAATCTVR